MRHTFTTVIAAAAVLAVGACGKSEADKSGETAAAPVATPAATAMPRLRGGLWKLTMVDGPPGDNRMCIDEALQEKMSVIGGQTTLGTCIENTVRPKPGGGYLFHSVCAVPMAGGGTSTSDGEVTGDFQNNYSTRVTVTTSGSSMASMNGSHTVQSSATYLGPCPEGMKSGDLEMAGGMRVNVAELAEASAKMQAPAAP